jgi:hypothetical protein
MRVSPALLSFLYPYRGHDEFAFSSLPVGPGRLLDWWVLRRGSQVLRKVRRVDKVICISRFTAEEAMAQLN